MEQVTLDLTREQAASMLNFLNQHLPDAYREVARTEKKSVQVFLSKRWDDLKFIQDKLHDQLHDSQDVISMPPIGESHPDAGKEF